MLRPDRWYGINIANEYQSRDCNNRKRLKSNSNTEILRDRETQRIDFQIASSL
jgi:hypothetical protein